MFADAVGPGWLCECAAALSYVDSARTFRRTISLRHEWHRTLPNERAGRLADLGTFLMEVGNRRGEPQAEHRPLMA